MCAHPAHRHSSAAFLIAKLEAVIAERRSGQKPSRLPAIAGLSNIEANLLTFSTI
jgi:hypothetical protein